MEVIFENKWCKVVLKDTYYIVQSKEGGNDMYFQSREQLEQRTGLKLISNEERATQVINKLREEYKKNPVGFDFVVSQYIAGDTNKELRRQIMKQLINEVLPLSKCGMYAVSNQLQAHFKQISLF